MSMTAVPISNRLVRTPNAASSGNGDPSCLAKWCTRKYAPSAPSSSAATASSIDCSSASDADRVCEPGDDDQCPNDRKPIFFTSASTRAARASFLADEAPARASSSRRSGFVCHQAEHVAGRRSTWPIVDNVGDLARINFLWAVAWLRCRRPGSTRGEGPVADCGRVRGNAAMLNWPLPMPLAPRLAYPSSPGRPRSEPARGCALVRLNCIH